MTVFLHSSESAHGHGPLTIPPDTDTAEQEATVRSARDTHKPHRHSAQSGRDATFAVQSLFFTVTGLRTARRDALFCPNSQCAVAGVVRCWPSRCDAACARFDMRPIASCVICAVSHFGNGVPSSHGKGGTKCLAKIIY
ncbi:hypothetical protein BaRGS_00019583 [Batillaria attramentaria]|uniref:Uncharacterized protein n=1 Tax=Batillaria attramentaria TaxID=370345 RepID=A0ABD0KR49_9CAEN